MNRKIKGAVPVKVIAEITDREGNPQTRQSTAKPRITARGFLFRKDGMVALEYLSRLGFYNIPGGGVEPGEALRQTLRREFLEETGYQCSILADLGVVHEIRTYCNSLISSHFFTAKTVGEPKKRDLTSNEKRLNIRLLWLPVPEAYRRISAQTPSTAQQTFIKRRNLAAFQALEAWTGREGKSL